MHIESYNGWTNWDTWEAYNLITSYEDLFNQAIASPDMDTLEALLYEALHRCNSDIEHLMFHRICWNELAKHLTQA